MAMVDILSPILLAISITAVVMWGALKLHKHGYLGHAVAIIVAIAALWVVGGSAEEHLVRTEVVAIKGNKISVQLNDDIFAVLKS